MPIASHRNRSSRHRLLLLGLLIVAFMAATTADASATLEIQNDNDPTGDPTAITYRLTSAAVGQLIPDFSLVDGASRSFGPDPAKYGNLYIFQAIPPAGWRVESVVCKRIDPVTRAELATRPGEFTVNLAAGTVTIDHLPNEDQYCTFTNSRVPTSGSSTAPSTGVAPTPPGGAGRLLSTSAVLLRITRGRRFAAATIRISRRSVIRAQLLRGKHIVGSTKVTRAAGTRTVKVSLTRGAARGLTRQGRKQVALTLRIVVVGSNGVVDVIRHGVIVRL
jgi:hypothetical protein